MLCSAVSQPTAINYSAQLHFPTAHDDRIFPPTEITFWPFLVLCCWCRLFLLHETTLMSGDDSSFKTWKHRSLHAIESSTTLKHWLRFQRDKSFVCARLVSKSLKFWSLPSWRSLKAKQRGLFLHVVITFFQLYPTDFNFLLVLYRKKDRVVMPPTANSFCFSTDALMRVECV